MPDIQSIKGQTYIGGLNRVFHCNHYNAYLQTAVMMAEGCGDFQPKAILADAVVPLVRRLRAVGYDKKELIEEFSFCGFGKLRSMSGGVWVTPTSHYGQAAIMQGKRDKSCFFNVGYIAGIVDLETEETVCKQLGAPADWYKTYDTLHAVPDYLKREPVFVDPPARFAFEECQPFETAVDEAGIVQAVSGLPLFGKSGLEDTGMIDAFGVVLTNHFADYYNYISYEAYNAMIAAGMPVGHVRDIFVQGGHICAFRTFGGIMESPEWYGLIAPNCKDEVDWLHGMVAVINALGWGVWRLEKVVPGKEIVMRIYNSYEGVGYQRAYPVSSEKQLSFLNMGAVQGLAHLFYKIDIRDKPDLTSDYYANTFNNPEGRFQVKQTHAIAAGDGYDRIVAWRA